MCVCVCVCVRWWSWTASQCGKREITLTRQIWCSFMSSDLHSGEGSYLKRRWGGKTTAVAQALRTHSFFFSHAHTRTQIITQPNWCYTSVTERGQQRQEINMLTASMLPLGMRLGRNYQLCSHVRANWGCNGMNPTHTPTDLVLWWHPATDPTQRKRERDTHTRWMYGRSVIYW